MKLRTLFCLLVFATAVAAQSVSAQSTCNKQKPWSCFGSIAVSPSAQEPGEIIRMQVYANGEIQVEMAGSRDGERKMLVLNSKKSVFTGVSDEEIKKRQAFMFVDYAFAFPLKALEVAYPRGLESVPDKLVKTPVQLDSKIQATLTLNRKSNTRVDYTLALPGGADRVLSGYWDGAQPAPLSGDFPLANWKGQELETYANLSEARGIGK